MINRKSEEKQIFLSLIVPAYNEEQVIERFYERTCPIMADISKQFEIIFIDDGSTDATAKIVKELHDRDDRIKLLQLSRNFGKEIALSAGLDFARGKVVVVTDADLQDPPELIPQMIEKWRQGYDVVYGTRIAREGESAVKRTTANLFYRIISRITKINIPKNTGDFRLMDQRVVKALRLLRENHRFMKGLFGWVGFRQIGLDYRREKRAAGTTKWNYWRLWNFAIEGITSFSYGPLIVASYLGVTAACLSFLYAAYLIIRTIIYGIDVPGYASTMVVILFFSGMQMMFLGIIGEYLGRMFNETKARPLYYVQKVIGLRIDKDGISESKLVMQRTDIDQ